MGSEKIITHFLLALRIVFFVSPTLQVILPTFTNPAFPPLFTSVLPRPSETSVMIRLAIGLVQLHILMIHYGMLAYHVSTLCILVYIVPGMQKNMR